MMKHPAFLALFALTLSACAPAPTFSPSAAPNLAIAGSRDAAPAVVNRGIYVSLGYGLTIFGYRGNNRANQLPICALVGVAAVSLAVDNGGNLIAPDPEHDQIYVYRGPQMCGPPWKSVADPYGPPTDASGPDALRATFVVVHATGFKSGAPGGAELCTLSAGCTSSLPGSSERLVGGVVMANNGDCWESAASESGKARLVYFKECKRSGVRAKHFVNASYGGLEIDSRGDLVSISSADAKLYVYRGCDPACSLVGGPFSLKGTPFYGHLNQMSTRFAVANNRAGGVDVYAYHPHDVHFLYRFTNSLKGNMGVVSGVAFNPRSTQ
ncbi:MAG TPA: hypothetical protein VGI19_03025 [Candidatus Cybelea sp.]|jgi:hypothetical protein